MTLFMLIYVVYWSIISFIYKVQTDALMCLLDAEFWVKLKRTSVTSQIYSLSPSK